MGALLLVFVFEPRWVALSSVGSFRSVAIFLNPQGRLSSAMTGSCANVMFIDGSDTLDCLFRLCRMLS